MNKKNIFSIIIVVLIIISIFFIWVIKNKEREELEEFINDSYTNNSVTNQSGENISNSDFDLKVTESLDIEKLKSYGLPIIIDFGADACIPCQQMFPDLVSTNVKTKEKAIVKFIDVWKYPDLAAGYPVELIPTQIFFNNDGSPYIPSGDTDIEFKYYVDKNQKHVLTAHVGILTESDMENILKEMGMDE